jgi:hypothetical protein
MLCAVHKAWAPLRFDSLLRYLRQCSAVNPSPSIAYGVSSHSNGTHAIIHLDINRNPYYLFL